MDQPMKGKINRFYQYGSVPIIRKKDFRII